MKQIRVFLVFFMTCCLAMAAMLAACGSQSVSRSTASESFASSAATEPSVEAPAPDASGVHHVLVIGDDSWEGNPPHADLMCLLRVDLDNKTITEVTVPRDTKYDFGGGSYNKLNQMLTQEGAQAQTNAVEEIVGVPIDYYVKINFDGFISIVDHFGGLDANLPYAIGYNFYAGGYPNEYFDAGEQKLTGWRAMALSRARTGYEYAGVLNEEMIRQYVDRQMLTTLIQYAYRDGIDNIEPLFKGFQGFIETNMPVDEQIAWAKSLGSKGSFDVIGTTGPFDGSLDADTELWLVTPDPDGWAALMDAVENDGDIEAAIDSFNYNYFDENTPAVERTTITVG